MILHRSRHDPFDGQYYGVIRHLLTMIGVWPYGDPVKIRRRFIITWLAFSPGWIYFITMLFLNYDNREIAVDCVIFSSAFITTLIMLCFSKVNGNRIKFLLDMLSDDWERHNSSKEIEIMHEYARRGTVITNIFAGYVIMGMIGSCCMPLWPKILDLIKPLDHPRRIQQVVNPPESIDQDIYFYPTWLFFLYSSTIWVLIYVPVLSLHFIFVHHTCTMFSVLGSRFNAPLDDGDLYERCQSTIVFVDQYDGLQDWLKAHLRIIKLISVIESNYMIPTFIMLIVGAPFFVFIFFEFRKTSGIRDFTKYGGLIISGIGIIFAYTNSGQRNLDHQEELLRSIYNAPWYNYIPGSRNVVLIIVQACLRQVPFTSSKIIVLSHDSFIMVIRAFLSALAVLRSMEQ